VATFAFVGQMVLVGKDLGVAGDGAEEVVQTDHRWFETKRWSARIRNHVKALQNGSSVEWTKM
jgi:hypothetical protein